MDTNAFIVRLKADTIDKNKCDLRKVHEEFKLFSKLPDKDRALFGLNVLRTLCWNLDKAPVWRDSVDNTSLLSLAIDCIRETRQMGREDRVKTLACIYHIHKYAVRLNKSIPSELVLKISIMPFELDSKYLLKEYYKTYWHILADRLAYLERLKTKANITKLLPNLTSDIVKVIQVYTTVQFCSTVILFLMKKLHALYSEIDPNTLVHTFKQIFSTLCEKDDVADVKELPESEIFDIYIKLNDCLYVVADGSSRMQFEDCILMDTVSQCEILVGHRMDLTYCLQTYVHSFCYIISCETDVSHIEELFNGLELKYSVGSKLEYEKALQATYPYLSQLFRLYIEYNVTNSKKFIDKAQESCLKLIQFFMRRLKNCNQLVKCENCVCKTGLHDAFRLSLLSKNIIQDNPSASVLDTFYQITTKQYEVVTKLETLGCANYQKYFRRLQTDVHNTAIALNNSNLYEMSIKLFDIYLRNELKSTEIDHKNISRALFNKSICELDFKLYETALVDAFLSLTFARQEGLKTDKYMSLVIDVKARELKAKCEEEETDGLQLVTVLDACKMALDKKMYGDLMPILSELKFSELLYHEWRMYCKRWPSVPPVAGVWRAARALARAAPWTTVEDEAALNVLYELVLETPSVVRTVHSAHFSTVVGELLEDFHNMSALTPDEKLVHAALLFLQFEYDLAEASLKYEWKLAEQSVNPDTIPSRRTVPQEHAATIRAVQGLRVLRGLRPDLHRVSRSRLAGALALFQLFVPLLQQLARRAPALQLAHYCCVVAELVGDRESYLRNAGVLLAESPPSPALDSILDRASRWERKEWTETDLAFLCEVAMYYKTQGKQGAAARLVRAARDRILLVAGSQPDTNLDLAVGRLLETQILLYGDSPEGPSVLTSYTGALRHYLGLGVTAPGWSPRRLRALQVRLRSSRWALRTCALAGSLGLRPRARAAAAAALPAERAPSHAGLHVEIIDLTSYKDAQVKIDEHLKSVLRPLDTSIPSNKDTQKPPLTPKQDAETKSDKLYCVHQGSPSDPVMFTVPTFKMPDFFHHPVECTCFACEIPACILLSCRIATVEATMYAFANETEIARHYYDGALDMIEAGSKKLDKVKRKYKELYEDFIVESVMNGYYLEFKTVHIKLLIDLVFFKLKNKEFDAADERIIEINEIVQEMSDVDPYLMHEILNLMTALAQLRKAPRRPDLSVEEFESLHLSPVKENLEPQRTPESKPKKPPKLATKMVVEKEELPEKRRIIEIRKIRLKDYKNIENDENDFEVPIRIPQGPKKDQFKVPNPIIPKAALEEATPVHSQAKSRILLSTPSDLATPKSQKNIENAEFFTPIESADSEVFFTPMTSVKTYTKRSLRQNIVKNLEQEFSTPGRSADRAIENKENSQTKTRSVKKIDKSEGKGEKLTVKEKSLKIKEESSKIKLENSKLKEESSTLKESSKLKPESSKLKEENSKLKESLKLKKDGSKLKEESSKLKEESSKLKEESSKLKEKLVVKENRSTMKENKSVNEQSENSRKKREVSGRGPVKLAPSSSRSKREEKKDLVRAVSPGKMEKEREITTRTRRQ